MNHLDSAGLSYMGSFFNYLVKPDIDNRGFTRLELCRDCRRPEVPCLRKASTIKEGFNLSLDNDILSNQVIRIKVRLKYGGKDVFPFSWRFLIFGTGIKLEGDILSGNDGRARHFKVLWHVASFFFACGCLDRAPISPFIASYRSKNPF